MSQKCKKTIQRKGNKKKEEEERQEGKISGYHVKLNSVVIK